ncbi:MAG: hypothetical protein ACFFBD_24205 [Candidatus Hodarchaeota archaeon]
MSIAITQGSLSHIRPKTRISDTDEWVQLEEVIEKLAPNWEVVEFQPERHELLLRARFGTLFNPSEIREILHGLQQRTQRSFVALFNSANQYALISVRG